MVLYALANVTDDRHDRITPSSAARALGERPKQMMCGSAQRIHGESVPLPVYAHLRFS